MTTKSRRQSDFPPVRAGMKHRICLLLLCVLTLPAACSVSAAPYPPEIAAWDNAEIRRQEENAVRLLKEINAAVAAGAKEYRMPRDHYRFSHDRARLCCSRGSGISPSTATARPSGTILSIRVTPCCCSTAAG